jgi:hypothetical protein
VKHHYVPASYLRLFTDPSPPAKHAPFVWVADFDEMRVYKRAPHNAAELTDYNAVLSEQGKTDHSAEQMLGEFESDAVPVFRRMIEGHSELTSDEFGAVIAYLALQFARIPAVRERLEEFFLSGVEQLAGLTVRDRASFDAAVKASSPNVDWTPDKLDALYGFASDPSNYSLTVHSSRSLLDAFTLAGTAEPIMAQMTWCCVRANRPAFFTSDNPVCLVNPKAPSWNIGHGLANLDSEITFAVGPQLCYWGVWGPGPPEMEADLAYIEAIQLRTAVLAKRWCFAPSEQLAECALAIRSKPRGTRGASRSEEEGATKVPNSK